MKIALIVLAALVIIAAALFIIGPPAGVWFFSPQEQQEEAQVPVPEGMVNLEPLGNLAIRQGDSEPKALLVTNMTDRFVDFSLGHAKTHLTLEPKTALIAPNSSRTIAIYIDDLFPPGGTEMMVYLLAETEGISFGMETYYISLEIIAGELQLQSENGLLQAYWKGEPAPPGVVVSYRNPEADGTTWRTWGETPNLAPPAHLRPGYHVFEFIAIYGVVESAVEILEIYVTEEEVAEESAAVERAPAAQQARPAAAAQEEPRPSSKPPPASPHMEHTVSVQDGDEESQYEPAGVLMPRSPGQGSRQWWEP